MSGHFKTALALILLASLNQAGELKLETTVQPELLLEEKGDFSKEGESRMGFNRARIGLRYSEKVLGISLKSRLNFDLAEESLDELIKNGYVEFGFLPQLELTLGRKKGLFGYENRVSSRDLPLVFRSETSSHLKQELGVSGFLDGVMFSGTVQAFPLSYGAAFTLSENDRRDGIHPDRLFSQTALTLSYQLDSLNLTYSANITRAGAASLDGTDTTELFMLHEAGISYRAPKLYSGLFTCFWGIDTGSVQKTSPLLPNYEENVSFSLYTSHEVKVPVNEELSIDAALGAEFLNGLNYYDGEWHDRSFSYVGYGSLGLSLGKRLRFQAAVKEKLDNEFSSINDMELAFQCSYFGSWKFKKEGKR